MKDLTTFGHMLITIDIGNTRIKMGLFDGSRLVENETFVLSEVEKPLRSMSSGSLVEIGL